MNPKRYLLNSLNVLNLLLTAAVIGFFIFFLNPLLGTPIPVDVPAPSEMLPGIPVRADAPTKPATTDYAPIGEKNLFHPDRMIPEEKKTSSPASTTRPELVLHGTMMTSEIKIAYLEDKKAVQKTPRRSAPYLVVKEGDAVSGYTLKQITENMIVLASGEEQMTLYLDELKVRKGEITGPTRASAPSPVATATPQASPRPAAPQPPARPSTAPPAPSAPPMQPRGTVSQPSAPAAPQGMWGSSDLRSIPPRPSTSLPPSPIRSGAP
ncbi:MAG: hypothetical protein FJ122_06405 [Deltaproteobacteria bacterium]|nr:hypothetical protein [Deltaproteobacteria bacterium]